MKLILNAITKFVLGFVLVGGLLFLPAWTVSYPARGCFSHCSFSRCC